jgi:hypothetical protein
MQSAGLPDLWVFAPRRGVAFWHEVKAADGSPSVDQVAFASLCEACGMGHVMGGIEEAKAKLAAIGALARVG